jgi:streptogramin lyase
VRRSKSSSQGPRGAVYGALVVLVIASCGGQASDVDATVPSSTPTVSAPRTAPPSQLTSDSGGTSTVEVPADVVGASGTLVWKTEDLPGIAGVRYPQSDVYALAADGDTVWIVPAHSQAVYRLDPASSRLKVVDTGPIGAPVDIEIGAGGVWAVGGNEWLHRIDPEGSSILESIEVRGGAALVATGTALWVATNTGNSLTLIDPSTNSIADRISFDGVRYFFEPSLAATDTSVWLTDLSYEEGVSVVRVDAATGLTETILAAPDSLTPAAVVTTDEAVWVLFNGELVRIDPVTGERLHAFPAAVYSLSDDPPAAAVGLVATDEGVWFGDANGNLSLVDPGSNQIIRSIELGLGTYMRLLGATDGALWLVDKGPDEMQPEAVLTRIDLP